jgi:hypothetical protein
MDDFSKGLITGLSLFPAVLALLGIVVYVLYRIEMGYRAVRSEEETPPPEFGDGIGQTPLPKSKGRTMWDLPDPFVPKDK